MNKLFETLKQLEWKNIGFDSIQSKPPFLAKREILLNEAKNCGARFFVETGTYQGDMLLEMAPHFRLSYSIELSHGLHEEATKRLKDSPYWTKAVIYQGDSRDMLPIVIKSLPGPALFWLDAHYSGGNTARAGIDTPIMKELEILFKNKKKVGAILIDDADDFDKGDYPRLIAVRALAIKNGFGFEIKHGMILIKRRANWSDLK